MKKVILAIVALVMISIVGLSVVGCSNVNQINFIHVVSRDNEQLTYTVQWVEYDATTGEETSCTDIGEFVYTFKRLEDYQNGTYNEVSYTLNGVEYKLSSGGVIKSELTITDGQYKGETMQAEVLFQNAFSPIASHKQYTAVGEDAETRSYTSDIDYTGKKIAFTINGEASTSKKPNYTYDNESLYFLVRGSDLSQKSYSLSVAGVNNLEGGTRSVSVAKASDLVKTTVPLFGDEVLECYMVRLTAASTYGSGTYADIYFLQTYKVGNIDVNKLPVRIDEGHVRYVLKSVTASNN